MSRRRRYEPNDPSPPPNPSMSSSDEQEITRCVCGQDELNSDSIPTTLIDLLHKESLKIDSGLFIQCDKCSVWQHGYCVGLFTDSEVPDKYCCEMCKPELHEKLYEGPHVVRTLYKPVNERRKKVSLDQLAVGLSLVPGKSRVRPKRTEKPVRKERRHYNYDEQLQKALRESARESGVSLEDKKESEDEKEPEPKRHKEVRKKKSPPTSGETVQTITEEIVASRPRYVSDKSSIYELRKRTGAILEWLGRSQVELEEEKVSKAELFEYKENGGEEGRCLLEKFNENLRLMEVLTEKILGWEERYGKYAP